MELKSISNIIATPATEINSYIDELVANIPYYYPWGSSSIGDLIEMLRNIPVEILTHPLVEEYIEACRMENLGGLAISALGEQYIFSDSTVKVVRILVDNRETFTIISQPGLDRIINNIRILREEGTLPENFKSRAELEIEIKAAENTEQIVEYLKLLGLLTEEEASAIIPIPSATLDQDETTARFSSALWFDKIQEQTVILAGVGGIGSYVAFLLSRMHPRALYMYDDDTVEAVNLSGQLFGSLNIGQRKVYAIGNFIRDMSNYISSFCINEQYTSETQTANVMICGFDNMEARKTFFENWTKHVESCPEEERKNCLFIDGRLAAEEFQVFSIRGDDTLNIIKYAKEYLFSDEEADDTLCSYRQTSYMANMIGSVMINAFTNFVANSIEDNIRELPFLTTYDGSTMTFKTYS